jgi:hypothetical protein
VPNHDITSNITGTKLAAMAPDSVRKLWSQGFLQAEQSADFFANLEGTGPSAPIQVKTDTSKGKGQKITFSVLSGFYDEPHIDEELFHTPDDFEELAMSDFDLTVGWARHGVRNLELTEEVMGMRGEIASRFNVEQGKWVGRLKSEQIFQLIMLKLNSDNVFYAGGKTLDTLTAADTLAWDEVTALGQIIKPLGGLPADIRGRNSKAPVWSNIVIPTEAAMNSLKLDPDYKTLNSGAGIRGDGNTMFSGVVRDIDGHVLHVYDPKDHDGIGAIGSPLNPKAQLGVAIAAAPLTGAGGTVSLEIKGGGNPTAAAITKKKYFKYFAGYAYKFLGIGAFAPATETRYLLVINPKNAATDPGKIGMYSYTTGNDGNKITLTGRLVPAANTGGIAVSTLGGVTWNTGVWANKHTTEHPVNATIIPCNAKGQAVGDTPMLLRSGILRGYGKYRGKRSQSDHEGEFVMDRFVTTVFGQVIREDRLGRHPGVARLRHALNYPELGLPIVV